MGNLLDTLQTQQQQFMGLPDQIAMEPTIPITFTKVGKIYSYIHSASKAGKGFMGLSLSYTYKHSLNVGKPDISHTH